MPASPCRRQRPENRRNGDRPAPACGDRPHWVSKSRPLAPYMLCKLRPGHKGKHVNSSDHRWEGARR